MAGPASQPETPRAQVPRTNRDPVRSLRPGPVAFLVKGKEYEIPALPAVDWLEVLMRPDWGGDDIFVELMPEGISLVLGDLEPDQAEDLALQVIEEVTGRHWWIAVRLIQTLAQTWDVMGAEATFNHVDPEKLSLAGWLDAMLVLLMSRLKDQDATMFAAQLEAPPFGEEIPEEELAISEGQFLSMAD